MIKYIDIIGYKGLGECGGNSHMYQWVEKDKETPMVILVHAYEGEPTAFKGYLYTKTKTFLDIPIMDNELSEIEKLTGKIKQQCFGKFIKNTIFRDEFSDFKATI